MNDESLTPVEREELFNKHLIKEYLKYGSVDEVFKRHNWDLPISIAGFYRLLDRWGIVKAAGPNNKLSEAIDFLEMLALEKIPLERLYKRLPPSFQTSAITLHRILHYVREGITRRYATALILTPDDNKNKILVGRDISTPRLEYGKPYGSYSLPMGFSKRGEARQKSILRVLQQEVFTQQTVDRKFPYEVIPEDPKPFVYFDVADIRLCVYHIPLRENLSSLDNFHSFKLANFQYSSPEEIERINSEFRAGVVEIVTIYRKYLEVSTNLADSSAPFYKVAALNKNLLEFAEEIR